MAEVYWIRHKDHTDVFSEGYVGFTTKTTQERFEMHKRTVNTKRDGNSHLCKSLRKYGSDVVVECLCVCDKEYGLWLENKLRPLPKIGWNMVEGGGMPPSHKGVKRSAQWKERSSKARRGKKVSSETLAKMRLMRPTEDQKRKISETLKKRHAELVASGKVPARKPSKKISYTDRHNANLRVHALADELYLLFANGEKVSRPLATKYDTTRQTLKTLWKSFSEGWVPTLDADWLTFKDKYQTSSEVADEDTSISNMENS